MKKKIVFIGALALSATAFAHSQFIYTDNLDVSGKKDVKMKVILGHPSEGKDMGTISVGTLNGKTSLPKTFFVIHNGDKQDLKNLAKIGKITTPLGETATIDAEYTNKDGLKGGGSWVFFMDPTETADGDWRFHPTVKLIVTKDNGGSDYNKRIAPGYDEIVPLQNPVNAWKENVFRAQFVDPNGKPIKGARVDVDFINVNINLAKDTYTPNTEEPKTSLRLFTDDDGILAFVPSRAGKWVIRAISKMDRKNKQVYDTSLVVQFD